MLKSVSVETADLVYNSADTADRKGERGRRPSGGLGLKGWRRGGGTRLKAEQGRLPGVAYIF